jgi:hypothetical protein
MTRSGRGRIGPDGGQSPVRSPMALLGQSVRIIRDRAQHVRVG